MVDIPGQVKVGEQTDCRLSHVSWPATLQYHQNTRAAWLSLTYHADLTILWRTDKGYGSPKNNASTIEDGFPHLIAGSGLGLLICNHAGNQAWDSNWIWLAPQTLTFDADETPHCFYTQAERCWLRQFRPFAVNILQSFVEWLGSFRPV